MMMTTTTQQQQQRSPLILLVLHLSLCFDDFAKSIHRRTINLQPATHHAPTFLFLSLIETGGRGSFKVCIRKKDLCGGCFVCCVHTMLHTKVAKQKPPKQNSLSCHRVFVAFLLLLDASAQQKKIKNWQTYKTKRKSDTYYYY